MVLTKSKKVILALALALAATAIAATALLREQQALSEKLIRLHVVANSDSEADQAIKLQVRDAVLAVTEPLMEGAEDPYAALSDALPEIESAAVNCLAALGVADPVTVTLGQEAYPTRVYESFSLPAGQYTSLRVTIGAGEGHNWWCVVFPSHLLRGDFYGFGKRRSHGWLQRRRGAAHHRAGFVSAEIQSHGVGGTAAPMAAGLIISAADTRNIRRRTRASARRATRPACPEGRTATAGRRRRWLPVCRCGRPRQRVPG